MPSMAGGVSARDARALAGQFGCEADLIQKQPKGSFATFVRGLTDRAIPLSFPFFILEKGPQRDAAEIETIRQLSRERYAQPLQPAGDETEPPGPEMTPDEKPDDDPSGSGATAEPDGTESAPAW